MIYRDECKLVIKEYLFAMHHNLEKKLPDLKDEDFEKLLEFHKRYNLNGLFKRVLKVFIKSYIRSDRSNEDYEIQQDFSKLNKYRRSKKKMPTLLYQTFAESANLLINGYN